MAEECYYIEELIPNSATAKDFNDSPSKINDKKSKQTCNENKLDVTVKRSQDLRLIELEQQLEMAETRCNTLKGQVDYMKLLYSGVNTDENPSKHKICAPKKAIELDLVKGKKRKRTEKEVVTRDHEKEEIPSRDTQANVETKHIQSSRAHRETISKKFNAEDAAAAVRSINNIISGITNSVHRISNLHVSGDGTGVQTNIIPNGGVQPVNYHQKSKFTTSQEPEKPYQTAAPVIEKEVVATKGRKSRRQAFEAPKRCSESNVREIRRKRPSIQSAADLQNAIDKHKKRFAAKTKRSIAKIARKSSDAIRKQEADKLIELYHNSAAGIIAPSEADLCKKPKIFTTIAAPKPRPVVQPTAAVNTALQTMQVVPAQQYSSEETASTRNYELPTIASKMKQVAKAYFENFNFRTIPFVAARSITPSHNLGINIQQVLSIIKGRKPMAGISPTLAYNIELAANKLGSRPLSALVSTFGSRAVCSRQFCPLGRRRGTMHYGRLQEMARQIPEEPSEVDTEVECGTAPGGTAPACTWSLGADGRRDQCTCVQRPGMNFSDVYSKYASDSDKPSAGPTRKYGGANRGTRPVETTQSTLMKDKMLKETIKNLHDEFERLTKRCEELKQLVANGKSNESIVKELEDLEKNLQKKEDEITMVLYLYKESQNLKQQVRALKKRASQCSVVSVPFHNKQKEFKDLNAAGHLTKLLRHVQQFQESAKPKNVIS